MSIRIAVALILVASGFFVGREFAYPAAWDEIRLGMSREQVLEKIGEPSYDLGEIKGAFWLYDRLLTISELNVYFDGEVASMVSIERRVGTDEHFYRHAIRFDFQPTDQLSSTVSMDDRAGISASNTGKVPIKSETLSLPPRYFGEWGGTNGGLIELSANELSGGVDEEKNKYKVLENFKTENEDQYLIEVLERHPESHFQNFVFLRFKNENQLYYYGYDSLGSFRSNAFSAAGEFIK